MLGDDEKAPVPGPTGCNRTYAMGRGAEVLYARNRAMTDEGGQRHPACVRQVLWVPFLSFGRHCALSQQAKIDAFEEHQRPPGV